MLVSALSFAAVSLAGLNLTGCGEPEEGFTYKKKVAPIFNNRCTICHRPGGPSGVDIQNPFSPDEGLKNSRNRFAALHPELNLPEYNVVEGDPDNSFLMYKIDPDAKLPAAPPGGEPPAGAHMPLQIEPLDYVQVHIIEEWVKAGAPAPDTPFEDPGAPATPPVPAMGDKGAIEARDAIPAATRTFGKDIQPIIGTEADLDAALSQTGGVCTPSANKPCPRCIYCHYENGPNLPDLTAVFDPVKGLVNAPARGRADMKRVDPGHPENSLLIQKIHYENFATAGVARSDYGAQMPYSFDPLSRNQVDTVRQWILEGAKP
ncbi:MAG TPA: hypothetical protein VFS67_34495 [Polyangiaceae bacterium]|nr:hypothetical protein [Polyangiaceae bacterium]